MMVCCSMPDELDVVCSAVSSISYTFRLHCCDLSEAEHALVLDKFRHTTINRKRNVVVQAGSVECVKEEQKSYMIVATDACLPILAPEESLISSTVSINYELPTKKVPNW
ncbi:hypothetical protein Hanom_Chr06g00547121 [Helianthus anomalus]